MPREALECAFMAAATASAGKVRGAWCEVVGGVRCEWREVRGGAPFSSSHGVVTSVVASSVVNPKSRLLAGDRMIIRPDGDEAEEAEAAIVTLLVDEKACRARLSSVGTDCPTSIGHECRTKDC